jgi:DNA-binding phage protein
MELNKVVKKAMIDLDIKGAVSLANETGLSKEKCFRLLKGDGSLRLDDVVLALNVLRIKIKYVSKGEE